MPGASYFNVLVNGSASIVSTVARVNDTLELTLATPVTAGQSVTVSYTDASLGNDAAAVQDLAGNDAMSFSGESVRNTVGTKVYYISASGSDDAGDGSLANPFASLGKVHGLTGADALQGGDTVYFLEGTYRNSTFGDGNIWKDSLSDFVLLFDKSGSAGNPITYAAAPGAHVVLEFDGPGAIRLQNAQYVNVQGFEVKGQNGNITLEEALAHQFEYRIDTDGDGSYLDEVSWFRPSGALTPGVTVLGQKPDGSDYVMPALVNGVTATLSNLGAKTPGFYGANAIVIAGTSNHVEILNNTVHDAPGAGISSLTGADYVTIRGNEFYNNNWFTPSGTHAISFKNITSSDTFTGAKVIVDGNLFSDNHSRMISWAPLQNDAVDMVVDEGKTLHVQNSTTATGFTHGQVQFSNNLIIRSGNAAITVNNAERIVMANNTIIDGGYVNRLIEYGLIDPNIHEGFQVSASGFRLGGTSLTVINNLISVSNGQTVNGVLVPLNVIDATTAVTGSGTGASLFADNLYFNGSELLRTTTGNSILDAGFIPVSTMEDLGFVDPATGNYFLLWTSQAINQGDTTTTNVTLVLPEDFAGLVRDGLIDLGAFEYLGDATPPAAGTLSVSGKDSDSDNTFSLVLSGQEAGSTVVLQGSADGGTSWVATTANQSGLAGGSYQFRAVVTDAAGNRAISPVLNVTVASSLASPATTAPAAPVITDIADDVGTDTVASSGDVSDDNTPTLTLTAATGSTVRVFDNGIYLGAATETGSTGVFTFTTPGLQVGSHSFTAKASDSNGNQSAASAAYGMFVGVTDSITYGGVTYNMTLTVANKDNLADGSFTLVATGQAAGDTVQYRESPNGSSSWGGLGSGSSPFTKDITAVTGTYYYQARIDYDAASTYDWTSPTLTVTVDTAATAAQADTTAPGTPTLVSSSPSSAGQVLTLGLAAEAGSTVLVFDGSTRLGEATETGSGTFTFTTGTLAAGTHAFTWRAIDAAGNASALASALSYTVSSDTPATGTLAVSGAPQEGGTLVASLSSASDADGTITSTTYQWQQLSGSHWLDLAGGDSANLSLPSDQSLVGDSVRVVATTTDSTGGQTHFYGSAQSISNVNDAPTGAVYIAGIPAQGQTLVARIAGLADADGLGALNYQWQADGSSIAGATSSTYTLNSTDVGKVITLVISYTDAQSTLETLSSAATVAVAAGPNPFLTLLSSTPSDGNGAVSVAADITLSFDAEVKAGSGLVTITRADGTVMKSIDITDATQVRFDGNKVIINPDGDLTALTGYSVQLAATAIQGLNGEQYGGIAGTSALNFTTGRVLYALTDNGDNNTAGSGTSADPYKSLGYASQVAQAGDTVYVRITDSSGTVLTDSTAVGNSYTIRSNGTADSPIVIKPEPGSSDVYAFTSANGLIVNGTHTVLEGFEFDGRTDQIGFAALLANVWTFQGNIDDTVFPVGDIAINVTTGQYITIRDNYFHDLVQKAVNIEGGRYVTVADNIIHDVATTSLSGGHGIMRQQGSYSNFGTADVADTYRWDIYGNLLFNVEQRIYSWVPTKGYMNMTLDEGKPILIDETTDTQMSARISNNVIAYADIDSIRIKPTANLEVSYNSIYTDGAHADGITDINTLSGTTPFSTTPFPGLTVSYNLVQTANGTYAFELNDGFSATNTTSSSVGNVYYGGSVNTSTQTGVTASNGGLFVNPEAGDFSPSAGISGVGASSATLVNLADLAADQGVTVSDSNWVVDHLFNMQTLLDNIPGVRDGVTGNETVFEETGILYAASTLEAGRKAYYFQVDPTWKTANGISDSALNRTGTTYDGLYEIITPLDYSTWLDGKLSTYKQWATSAFDGAEYTSIRYGDSYMAQNKVLDATGLYIATIRGDNDHDITTATGKTVTLDGDILIDFEGYTPSAGTHSYDILTAGSINGSFDHVRIEGLGMGSYYSINIVENTTLRVTVSDTSFAGATALLTSPLALDLNGDGVQTVSQATGVQFDLDGDGLPQPVGWLSQNDAWLVRDLNQDGLITSGKEMFGTATELKNGQTAEDGFSALAELDDNNDGLVNHADAAFEQLQLWIDANQNGISETEEMQSLAQAGITTLHVRFDDSDMQWQAGNLLWQRSTFDRSTGDSGALVDVWLAGTADLRLAMEHGTWVW